VYPEIDITGLSLVADNEENFVNFMNEVGRLLNMYPPDENDFTFILNTSVNEVESSQALEVLNRYEALYTDVTSGLIEVPVSAQSAYIDFANGLSYLIEAMNAVVDSEENPVRGLAGMARLQDAIEEYFLGLEGITDYIRSQIAV